ncbi:MAG: hypothetical protein QW569_05305 [Candidatus Bathyarchaeia archaeon]|nr:hypothetical protein [Candidatus Bathyarchaeota archaeon]
MPYCPVCDRDFPATNPCPQCGTPMLPRATAGFGVSLAAGAVILITTIIAFLFWPPMAAIIFYFMPWLAIIDTLLPIVWTSWIPIIGLITSLMIIVGATLIYLPGKERAGAALVLIFSLVSLVVLGGFIVGITMGVVGAALGFAKK